MKGPPGQEASIAQVTKRRIPEPERVTFLVVMEEVLMSFLPMAAYCRSALRRGQEEGLQAGAERRLTCLSLHPKLDREMICKGVTGFVLASLLLVTMSGCAALVVGAAGGAAGAVYVMGQLKDRLDATVPQVHQATVAALKDLDLSILEEKGDKLTAHVESEFSDGKHVWIAVEADGEDGARITIRVGMVGDEAKSRAILDAIRRHL